MVADVLYSCRNHRNVLGLRAIRAFDVVARLKPGVTIEAARTELGAIADRLAREYPEANKGAGVILVYCRRR